MSATNRGSVRNEYDFYPTPLKSFTPLLKYLQKEREYYEPACGDNRLVNELIKNQFIASGNDIQNGVDYLEDNTYRDVIITNPPFSLAFKFIQHARLHSKTTYMLLRLNFLGSKMRKEWFSENEPSSLYVLSERPSFTGKGTDATDYAWFGWNTHINGIYHL